MIKTCAVIVLALYALTGFAAVDYGNPKISQVLSTNAASYGLILKSDGTLNYWGSGDGLPGDRGLQGEAGKITINSTSNGVPGSQAAVTNIGDATNAVLDFLIPVGSNGAPGAVGATGVAATVVVGGVSNLAFGASAYVTNGGNSNAATFYFGIPAGSNGPPGAQGGQGIQGNPGIQGPAGPAMTNWSAYPATNDVNMGGHSITNIKLGSLVFTDGTTISSTNVTQWNTAVTRTNLSDYNDNVGYITNASEYPAAGDLNMANHSITNVKSMTLGSVMRTNWPTGGGGGTGDVSTWSTYVATQDVDMGGKAVTNANKLVVTNSITLGGVARTNWPTGGAGTTARYLILGTAGEEAYCSASDVGVTAAWVGTTFHVVIPSGVVLHSLKFRVSNTVRTTSGIFYVNLGTTDMGNTGLADRWNAISKMDNETGLAGLNNASCVMDTSPDTLKCNTSLGPASTTVACHLVF